MIQTIKKTIYLLWIFIIVGIAVYLALHPDNFTPEKLVNYISSFQSELLVVYIGLTFTRGLFLLPSSPLIIGGAILFPDILWLVLLISLAGILFSATALYYFSDVLGISHFLEKRHPKQLAVWKQRLSSPKATLLVMAWSIFPLVPTDLICYVAGIVKMPYRYMMLGLFIGGLILCTLYVYFGATISNILL